MCMLQRTKREFVGYDKTSEGIGKFDWSAQMELWPQRAFAWGALDRTWRIYPRVYLDTEL